MFNSANHNARKYSRRVLNFHLEDQMDKSGIDVKNSFKVSNFRKLQFDNKFDKISTCSLNRRCKCLESGVNFVYG